MRYLSRIAVSATRVVSVVSAEKKALKPLRPLHQPSRVVCWADWAARRAAAPDWAALNRILMMWMRFTEVGPLLPWLNVLTSKELVRSEISIYYV